MNEISSWLLSIAGIILVSVIAEFVMPEGQMNKYTKVIFSFIIILVVIMPIPSFLGKKFDFSKWFNSSEQVLQEDYLYQINIDKLSALNEDINKTIKNEGVLNVKLSISANVLCESLEIYGVDVDLSEIEYDEKFENKTIVDAKIVIRNILDTYSILADVEVNFNE